MFEKVWIEDFLQLTVNTAVTSGLRPDQAATPREAFTGKDTLPLVPVRLVGTKQPPNLPPSNTNIARGNIRIGTNMPAQLPHKRIAELPDLRVALPLGVKVTPALTTTNIQARQRILEDLLESQELEDRQVDGGVEAETTLVGAKCRVELHTVALLDLALALIVLPDDAELNDALGDGDDFEGLLVLGVLGEEGGGLEGGDELCVHVSRVGNVEPW